MSDYHRLGPMYGESGDIQFARWTEQHSQWRERLLSVPSCRFLTDYQRAELQRLRRFTVGMSIRHATALWLRACSEDIAQKKRAFDREPRLCKSCHVKNAVKDGSTCRDCRNRMKARREAAA